HHIELPAGELAREPDVLPAAADGLRELLLRDRDVHAVRILIDDDRHDFRRRHGIDDELRRVLVVGNDIHPLAGNLVGDRLHARAAHADTRAHRIDARIIAAHRDLGTHARVTGGSQDLDETLADLRHLELEELDQKLRRRARQEKLRPTQLRAHLLQEGLDAILRLHLLARNHVRARHEPLRVGSEVDENTVAIDALHHAAHERADAIAVGVHDLLALRLAHLLHDDLLGLLGGNAAEGHRLHRLLDEAADLGLRVELVRILHAQLPLRRLELRRVVRKHLPTAKRLVVPALAVDGHAGIPLLAVLLAGSRSQSRFERLEDYLLVDAFLVGDCIDDHQDFLVHYCHLSPASLSAWPCQSLQKTPVRAAHRPRARCRPRPPKGACRCSGGAPRAPRPTPRTPASRRSARNAPECAAPGRIQARKPRAYTRWESGPRHRAAPRLPGSPARSPRAPLPRGDR